MEQELIEVRDKYINYLSNKSSEFVEKHLIYDYFDKLIKIENDSKHYLNDLEKIWINKINSGKIDDILEEIMYHLNEYNSKKLNINFEHIITKINNNDLKNYFKGIREHDIEYFKGSKLLDAKFLRIYYSANTQKNIIKYYNILNKISKNRSNFLNFINKVLETDLKYYILNLIKIVNILITKSILMINIL